MQFVAIRAAKEQEQMLELLREGFPDAGIDWPAVFDAPPGRSGHGLLLIADGRAQGGMLMFEKAESLGGRERYVVNLSSWYIRPEYRLMALSMARTATSDPDTIYTSCSPTDSVQAIYLRIGFRCLSQGSIVSVPLLNGIRVERDTRIEPLTAALAGPEHRRWLADHADPRCIPLVIRQRSRAVPVLWVRGLRVKGLPAARLLFTADYGVLRSALPAVHAHMLRRRGIVGLYLPRLAPLADLRSASKRHGGPSFFVKGEAAETEVNLLYSELLYLRPDRKQRRGPFSWVCGDRRPRCHA